jgi:hypothetical protein
MVRAIFLTPKPLYYFSLCIDSIITHNMVDWRHISPILIVTLCSKCFISPCRWEKLLYLTLPWIVQKKTVSAVSLVSCFECWRMQMAKTVRLPTFWEPSVPSLKVSSFFGVRISSVPWQLHTLTYSPVAGALGLFEPEQPDHSISYSMLIQNFIRFILEQLHQETFTPTSNPIVLRSINAASEVESSSDMPSTIQQVFGLKTTNYSKCSHCSNEIIRTTYPYVVDIMYPKKVSNFTL